MRHNRNWDRHTRPMLEAFRPRQVHDRNGGSLRRFAKATAPMPSGYAALLYLYDLR